ncbi:MAG TPA: biotin--[acetyl-CoA-carboxylase] ligase [Candidatus Omnitrophota bacterium]|nr:biotin--[acetyl-CoA-carboxylase] ligase [Candidatus Omnitrophota bacterium]HPT07491.1 biotin--[acetyl-CoA-carboxylase] ligase [Candidatus Omnitrophota bacterium]
MHERILACLKSTRDYVSGEEISNSLKISRQALWKHIHQLKDAGYDIVAVPHLGYKLISSPDRLFVQEVTHGLETKVFGRRVYFFENVSSTMDIAMQRAMEGEPEGALILAETQTKGRGRMGRAWISQRHKGIYASFIVRPKILPTQAPVLTLLTAVSICEAVYEYCSVQTTIKWPNDIFIGGKKLCGILTELEAESDQVHCAVIGFGINVNNEKKSLVPVATSLFEETGHVVNRAALLQIIMRHLETKYFSFLKYGPNQIIEKWRQYSITLGCRVKVSLHKSHLEGQAVDIDDDGALLIRKDNGLIQRLTAGDIIHCR